MYKLSAEDKILCSKCIKKADKFNDLLSLREFTLTGICQKCQETVFDGANLERGGANIISGMRRIKGERYAT